MRNLTTEEKILAIANGSLSCSRIAKIYQAKHGQKIPPAAVGAVCKSHGISTPKRGQPKDDFERQYPDEYTFYFEGRKIWGDVRNIWGDNAAIALKESLSTGTLRSLYPQLADYTDASIQTRQPIDYANVSQSPLEVEKKYSLQTILTQYLNAFEDEFADNPDTQSGKAHPLFTAEYQQIKAEEIHKKCISRGLAIFPDELAVIAYFAEFWQAVKINRGELYFDRLCWHFGHTVGNYHQKVESYYCNNERDFRVFLSSLEDFKTRAPWKVDLLWETDFKVALPTHLEGLLLRYGWREVQSMVACALLT